MEIFLTNENRVRSLTNIDSNVQSKFLMSAIREAQDFGLQSILGYSLYERLKNIVNNGQTSSYPDYKDLLDYCQTYLAYKSVVNLCLITAVKISNGGLQQTSDENLNVLGIEDTKEVQKLYQDKADFYAKRLQEYLLVNKDKYAELSDNDCRRIKSNLYSAASTGIFLGGRRGKK